MSRLGVGVMLRELGGNAESVAVFNAAVGKEIAELRLGGDDALHFVFADGTKMRLVDDGQSCCETRYMRTDDDLSAYVGAKLISAEVRSGPEVTDDCADCHEIEFLVVETSKGSFTMASHNEHNGYYGGFYICARAE